MINPTKPMWNFLQQNHPLRAQFLEMLFSNFLAFVAFKIVAHPFLTNNNTLAGDYLLAILLSGAKNPKNALSNADELPHFVAILVPNKLFFVKQTMDFLTHCFTAGTSSAISRPFADRILGTYTFDSGKITKPEISWLAVSWMNEALLNKNWDEVLNFAKKLRRNSGEESIAIIKDGSLILVRD